MDQVWVLLLRGVNVGGRHRLAMADFRILLDSLGFQGVATHIQSGNAVFRAPADPDLAQRIGAAITAKFGFPAEVFLLPLANYLSVLQANPFTAEGIEDGAKVHVFFLARPAPETNLAALATLAAAEAWIRYTRRRVSVALPNEITDGHQYRAVGKYPAAE